ncbi:ABC transporter ATP-binding protein [Leptolyngbya iicbica]|uniref:ABC transporter ATP-binding protein n=2 Tax=Cyanophyceae TaxID=3028117 RepID=A0A4Q7EJ04_9CYAN|nr:ABC transporter ATP-binding protein [Leptolyngbya sp. LK]RZM81769.1 ABC transporter ATP-binding protein [Leptolyngbya sp. LK]
MTLSAPGTTPNQSGLMTPLKPVVLLQQISRIYGTGEAMIKACDRISLTIHRGEYCAIMGESGSGKTTLMNIIGCLDRPSRGRYELDGVNVAHLSKNRLARLRNRQIGFVFQRYELLNNLTALENVTLPLMYAGVGRRQRQRLAMAALQRMGLGHRLDKRPSQLSGGQQQRVAIARAIVNRPLLLLADEPTGALDTQSAETVMTILNELHASGMTIIMVTHSHEVACYSKRIIQVSDGHIVNDHLSPQEV